MITNGCSGIELALLPRSSSRGGTQKGIERSKEIFPLIWVYLKHRKSIDGFMRVLTCVLQVSYIRDFFSHSALFSLFIET